LRFRLDRIGAEAGTNSDAGLDGCGLFLTYLIGPFGSLVRALRPFLRMPRILYPPQFPSWKAISEVLGVR
jgi:hypothetical protein